MNPRSTSVPMAQLELDLRHQDLQILVSGFLPPAGEIRITVFSRISRGANTTALSLITPELSPLTLSLSPPGRGEGEGILLDRRISNKHLLTKRKSRANRLRR